MIKKVVLKLQTIKKLAETQKVEIEVVKKQLQEIELKSTSLKKIDLLKVRE